jgi:hypothetical protein
MIKAADSQSRGRATMLLLAVVFALKYSNYFLHSVLSGFSIDKHQVKRLEKR